MVEITKVVLENEMDLILSHKQTMRLAELTGLSLASQTTFATAVSEVSRNAIIDGNVACLTLYVSDKREQQKYITAVLEDNRGDVVIREDEGFSYAKRLVSNIEASSSGDVTKIELRFRIPQTTRVDDQVLEKWRILLNTDPAISPYEEIKRKNRQLVELADKLRGSEQEYISLTDSLPIMIFTSNSAGNITYGNKWLCDYTKLTFRQLQEKTLNAIIHPEDYIEVLREPNRSYDNPVLVDCQIREGKTGEYRWHSGISTPVIESNGEFKCWNTFLVDVHAKKLVEQTLRDNVELLSTKKELEEKISLLNESNRQLEQYAYVASHDLQEPLRKISFYSDYLKTRYEHVIPTEDVMYFNNLVNATARMRTLISDILAYSTLTIENKALELVDLNKTAQNAIEDLEISLVSKNAQVSYDNLPIIKGDASQLKQLFANLLSNSIKYTKPDSSPVVTISSERTERHVVLYFKDNGIGFETVFLDKMFDLFQRLHTKDRYSGTGIGLAICKKIVAMHNGTITADSEPGKGATFIISLPILSTDKQPAN